MHKQIIRVMCASLLASSSGVALSQESLSDVSGDIIVTAQKREQSLADVGLTIAAASADTLLDRGITNTEDLSKLVPGFTATVSGYNTPVYTLRGIGLFESSIGATPSVAVYVDEIARPFAITQAGVGLDIERVEILKGPQGTLFGQSATGGAINYIAAKPTDEFAAGGNVSYERFGRADLEAFVSGPLADTLKGRLAGRYSKGGAWQYSASRPNDKNGDTDFLQGRIILDWEPDDRLRFSLNINGFRDKSQSLAPQFMLNTGNVEAGPGSGNPYAQIDPALYAAWTDPSSPGFDSAFLQRKLVLYSRMNGVPWAPGANVFPTDPEAVAHYLGGPNGDGTALCDGNNDRCIRQAEWNPEWPIGSDDHYYQFALRADFDITDNITLTSLTSYQKAKTDRTYEGDGTLAQGFQFRLIGTVRNFNQELRLAGTTGGLTWILGGNYDWAKTGDINEYHDRDISVLETFPGRRFVEHTPIQNQRIRSYALFANGEYALTPQFTVLAGLRYTSTKRRSANCATDPSASQNLAKTFGSATEVDLQDVLGLDRAGHVVLNPGDCYELNNMLPASDPGFLRPVVQPFEQDLNEDNLSFRVGANYKFDGGTLVYATVSRGYKAGVITSMSPAFANQYIPAVQERVMAYEAGIKAPLFDRRLNFNAAAFYYDYKDKQIRARVLDPIFGTEEKMINVPESYVFGIEAEILTRPVDGLTLSASGTYLKTKVSGHFSTFGGGPIYNMAGYTGDFKGSPLPFTPEWSGVFDGQYEHRLSNSLTGFFGGTVLYQSKTNTTFYNEIVRADDFFMRSHATVDLRGGIGDPDGAWRLTAFVRNLTNKYYEVSVSAGTDARSRLPGMPRIYGLQLRLRTK